MKRAIYTFAAVVCGLFLYGNDPAESQDFTPLFRNLLQRIEPGQDRRYYPNDFEQRRERRSTPTSEAWTRIAPANGLGTTVCNKEGDLYACFALRCLAGMDPQFMFFFNAGQYAANPTATIVTDGSKTFNLPMITLPAGGGMASSYDAAIHAPLLDALRAGKTFTFDPGFRHRFGLRGAAAEIDRTVAACGMNVAAPRIDVAKASAPATATQQAGPKINMFWNTRIVAASYRDGKSDPALASLDRDQCQMFCLADRQCRAYTHEPRGNLCTLRNETGRTENAPGASSGLVEHGPAPPAGFVRQGPKAVLGSPTYWRENDTRASYVARIRAAAVSEGGACAAEETTLRRMAAGFEASLRSSVGVAGEAVSIDWKGNTLDARIPTYLIVSSDRPVRFDGAVIALPPGAVAPFGIETRAADSRGVVALHVRSSGRSGSIAVKPLVAGDGALNATLVGYLRACQKVVELSSVRLPLTITPAAPRIVLHDPLAPSAFGSRVSVPEFQRIVRFDAGRFQILDERQNSEIVDREGTELALSATRRFVAVRRDQFIDVIDIVDGATVAQLGDGTLHWFNNDAFVVTDSVPWGLTWLSSTLSRSVEIKDQRTSCSACSAVTEAMLNVDLENGVAVVAGPLGFSVTDLHDPAFERSDGGDPDMRGVGEAVRVHAGTVGPVSAIPFGKGWNSPLGLRNTYGDPSQEASATVAKSLRAATIAEATANREAERSTQQAVVTGPVAPAGTELRLASSLRGDRPDAATRSTRTLLAALQEFGFSAAPGQAVDALFAKPQSSQVDDASESAGVRGRIAADLRKVGRRVRWTLPVKDELDTHCNYFSIDKGTDALPGDLGRVHRIVSGDRVIWVLRGRCDGGPTFGTLMSKSYLAVLDGKRVKGPIKLGNTIVEESETLGNSPSDAFHRLDYELKILQDRYLLMHAPGKGAISLFDLTGWRFLFTKRRLARGDLLKDAHLSADARHVLQENSDGSFGVLRVADGASVVEGRFIDDEVVLWNRDFQFDATPEGASYVYLTFPGEAGQYSLQQFGKSRSVRGLMAMALAGSKPPAPGRIGPPPRLGGRLDLVGGHIVGQIQDAGRGGIRSIRLYQDGMPTDLFPMASGSRTIEFKAARLPGARFASLVAEDDAGLLSLPVQRDLGPPTAALPSVRLLAVGIDYYADPALGPLDFAKTDAAGLFEALSASSGRSLDLRTGIDFVLPDRRASREAILARANELVTESRPGETTIFFFAGHGLRGANGRFYLGTSETKVGDIERTALAWDDLAAVLGRAKGRILVMLDACHSGVAGLDLFATNDDAVERLRSSIGAPLMVLSAAKGRQTSAEVAGDGLFTRAVREAITKDRATADTNRNGAIEISELYRYVKTEVSKARGGLQTPWLSRNHTVGDVSLF